MNKKIKDKKLQAIIFEAVHDDEYKFKEDADYYKILKKALATTPEMSLPENFAFEVTKKAARRKYLYHILRTAGLYLGTFSTFLALGAFALFFLAKDVFYVLVEGIEDYKYPTVFGLLVFVLVQVLDELLVQKKIARFKP